MGSRLSKLRVPLLLLVGAAACAGWARSRWSYDVLAVRLRASSDWMVAVISDSGWLCVASVTDERAAGGPRLKHFAAPPGRIRRYRTVGPVVFDRHVPEAGATGGRLVVGVPYWLLLAAPATVWAAAAWRRKAVRRRHAAGGLCRACGYDLRGTGVRCPECGALR